ncbi:pheST operon leader peptide PheM [Pectobacterium aquaticum]|uniref:pheST attenuator peptide n=1 Tax=Pectobacterium aquaticum TaxID=2204145 RepID=A0AA93DNG3_9GAMM|nr:pheST operon leader peptide PheM [Pectobacterium aquaticum]RRN97648.1 pheST operon leader peptide PheM [Pectobacterium aquaticum]RRO08208.1 pheST operon leader peptide PheM [Pectobacterium aquaticum]RRO11706.1 pheST operon leader peptide PheM [Pectobacterium aquaticum]RRO19001.1 pheST operon leader peptide PheM [Pectobacterium aquaticum]
MAPSFRRALQVYFFLFTRQGNASMNAAIFRFFFYFSA